MDAPTAERSAMKEIRGFLRIERYASYTIEGRSYSLIASCYEYTVQFSRS